MQLFSEYLPYIGIGMAVLLCIFLGIANFIHLLSISSKANRLEREIEKKTTEFDSLRKEKQSYATALEPKSIAESIADNVVKNDNLDSATIQIVRNVGGTFETTENILENKTTEIPQSKPQLEAPMPKSTNIKAEGVMVNLSQCLEPQSRQTTHSFIDEIPIKTISSDNNITFQKNTADSRPQSSITNDILVNDDEKDVLDIVSDTAVPIPPRQPAHTELNYKSKLADSESLIRIPLYSPATKDADFASALEKISEALANNLVTHIELDMANILFLYEKELDYLEKITHLVKMKRRDISLVHCEKELLGFFSLKPSLLALVKPTA